ncbi:MULTISPECIES: glycoside hydrolase family 19 protein [unclassified Pseudomonas]|uniref:glycoside hydrolase family 19 protein n=1 Tax=unclassified Pseudomonas TaxID=196821 RepID=UPI000A1DD5AF|nr:MULTISPECIES: glycoside hydrolase family 19 protein [unclassified Pseudomonas]
MALQHDAATGFLRGESIADDVEKYAQELKLLRAIEANTRDISKRLMQLGTAGVTVTPEPTGTAVGLPAAAAASPESNAPQLIADNVPAVPRQPGTRLETKPDSQARDTASRAAVAPTPTALMQPRGDIVSPRQPTMAVGEKQGGRDTPEAPDAPRAHAAPPQPTVSAQAEHQAPTAAATQRGQAGNRDAAGRFVSSGSLDYARSTGAGEGGGSSSESKAVLGVKAVGGAIVEAVRDLRGNVGAGADSVDPSIQASKEVGAIFTPMFTMLKPFGRIFGRNSEAKQAKQHRESVNWWRKIWRAQDDANKQNRGRGLLGVLAMFLPLLAALLAPLKVLGRLLGLGALGKALGGRLPGRFGRSARGTPGAGRDRRGRRASSVGAGRQGGSPEADRTKTGRTQSQRSAGGAAARMGKGLLRKLPIIGALIGGGMLAADAMAGDDPALSKEENKRQKWGNVGGGVGGLIGGAVGMLGGPAGAIIGAAIGENLGSVAGEWLAKVDFDTAVTSIKSAFDSLASNTSAMAESAFKSVKDAWAGLVSAGASALSGMVSWAKDTWDKASEQVLQARDTVADKVSTAKSYVSEKATSVADAGRNVLYKATGGRLGASGSAAAKEQMIQAMDAGGITDPKSKAMLMANVDHESGGFTKTEENLNYSAKRLQQVFPKYYKNVEDARADAGNPEAIANRVYGGRMGNTEAGDGFKYRGRGALQLTGKAQYEAMGKKLGIDLVNNPDLAADPKYSAQIAVAHWKASGADKAAQAGDLVGARKRTNGGTNGLADVESKYDAYLAQAKAGDLTPTRRADEMKVAAPEPVKTAVANTMATIRPGQPRVGAQSGTGPVGVLAPAQPVAAKPASPAGPAAAAKAPTVTPIGVMAMTQPRTQTVAPTAPTTPAAIAAPTMRSYAPAAADASQAKIPAVSEVKTPLPSGGKGNAPAQVNLEVPLTQNVGDRSIAHAAAGGIGMHY